MKKVKNIINMILVFVILLSGAPFFTRSSDVNRNDAVDLEDAVIQVRHFAVSADRPDQFAQSMEDTLTTLQILAGLKQAIRGDDASQSYLSQPPHYIPSSHHFTVLMSINDKVSEFHQKPISIAGDPEIPPPRLA